MRHFIPLFLTCALAFTAQAETGTMRSDVKHDPVYPPSAPTVAAPAVAAVSAPANTAVATPHVPALPATPVAAAPMATKIAPPVVPAPVVMAVPAYPQPVAGAPAAVPALPAAAVPTAADAATGSVEVGYDPKVKRDPKGKAILQTSPGGSSKKSGGPMAKNTDKSSNKDQTLLAHSTTKVSMKSLAAASNIEKIRQPRTAPQHGHASFTKHTSSRNFGSSTRMPRSSGKWSV